VLYFGTTCTNDRIIAAMKAGRLGQIVTPKQFNPIPDGVTWCADNGKFGKGWVGDEKFTQFLRLFAPQADRCKFAVAPDVPFEHEASLALSRPWLPLIRSIGYPVALAVQDGGTSADLPWGEFDVLFIGGTDEFKASAEVVEMVAEARLRGLWVHMGRVNTRKRLLYSAHLGCHSGDGQFFRFGPDENLGRMLRYLEFVEDRAGGMETWVAFASSHPAYRERLAAYQAAA
jgi:hypothetical protein